jgi:pimeloyl-ACP methyl ester carboxylesterase
MNRSQRHEAIELERTTLGPLPALAGGEGPPLLYLGGLLPVAGVDPSLARRSAEFSVRPFREIRRVIYTNRRPGLPRGMTFADLAAEHAAAIVALDRGPVDVLGVSTGGSIAQQLAADHPATVRRLVLVSTGCRLSAETRRMQARVAQDVRDGKREEAFAAMAVGVAFPRGEPLARFLAPLTAPLARHVGDLSDLATTIEAEDTFDLARCERAITAPTLIVAGARDRFYPAALLEETQRLIPGSVLLRIPRRGHMTVMGDSRLVARVREHLDGSDGAATS